MNIPLVLFKQLFHVKLLFKFIFLNVENQIDKNDANTDTDENKLELVQSGKYRSSNL